MTTPDPIVQFIRDRLDEDARAAEVIRDGGYAPHIWKIRDGSERVDDEGGTWVEVHALVRAINELPGAEVDEGDVVGEIYNERCQADHIARHDPDRVLRGVWAKWRIVSAHVELGIEGYCGSCGTHDTDDEGDLVYEHDEYPCRTLRLVASEWSDHEDYRKEWKP